MSEEKLPRDVFLSITFLALAGEIAWAVENQFYNVFIDSTLVDLGFPQIGPIAIALMVNITTIVGTLATVIMGSYSDVLGKRKPFLLYGLILWAITTAIFPFSAFLNFGIISIIFFAILFDSIMTFFGGTVQNAAVNAYITDVTNLKTRSKAQGIKQIATLLSLLIVYGVLGLLIDVIGYYAFFFIVGGLVALIGLIGVSKTKEPAGLEPLEINTFQHIKNTFKKKSSVNYKQFFIILLVIAGWNIGLNVFFPYLIIYLRYTLNGLTPALIVNFFALLTAIILSIPLSKLTNKLGRKKMTLISTLLFSAGIFFVGLSPEIITLLISGTLTFIFYAALSISTFTWVKDLYPEEGRGQFSGYWNLFAGTIPMVIGPIIGGIISTLYGVTALDEFGRTIFIPPNLLFFVAAIVSLGTLIPLIFAKEIKVR